MQSLDEEKKASNRQKQGLMDVNRDLVRHAGSVVDVCPRSPPPLTPLVVLLPCDKRQRVTVMQLEQRLRMMTLVRSMGVDVGRCVSMCDCVFMFVCFLTRTWLVCSRKWALETSFLQSSIPIA